MYFATPNLETWIRACMALKKLLTTALVYEKGVMQLMLDSIIAKQGYGQPAARVNI